MAVAVIASTLREIRESRGLSRVELALLSGVSHGTITKIEQGRQNPNAETIIKLADALDASADVLLGRTGSKDGPPADPLDEIVGWAKDVEPVDDIDAVIYGYDR